MPLLLWRCCRASSSPPLLQILPGLESLKKDLGNDTSLTDGDPRKLEMRAMLEDPIGQKYIGQFAKKVMTQVRGGLCKAFLIKPANFTRRNGLCMRVVT